MVLQVGKNMISREVQCPFHNTSVHGCVPLWSVQKLTHSKAGCDIPLQQRCWTGSVSAPLETNSCVLLGYFSPLCSHEQHWNRGNSLLWLPTAQSPAQGLCCVWALLCTSAYLNPFSAQINTSAWLLLPLEEKFRLWDYFLKSASNTDFNSKIPKCLPVLKRTSLTFSRLFLSNVCPASNSNNLIVKL